MVNLSDFAIRLSGLNEFQSHHFQMSVLNDLTLSFPIYKIEMALCLQGAASCEDQIRLL